MDEMESTAGNLPDMASTSTTMMASVSDVINATVTDVMTSMTPMAATDSSTNITTTDAAAMGTFASTDQQGGVTSVLTGMMSSVSDTMSSVVKIS